MKPKHSMQTVNNNELIITKYTWLNNKLLNVSFSDDNVLLYNIGFNKLVTFTTSVQTS